MKLSLAATILALSTTATTAGCGKRSAPPPPERAPAPAPANLVAPAATPNGVVGCGTFSVAIPDDAKKQYIVLRVDTDKAGASYPHLDFSQPRLGVSAYLEVYEKPVSGEAYCTDFGTEEQTPKRYFAVRGHARYEMHDKLLDVVIEDARFVDADGKIIDVAKRTAENVRVGWLPG